MCIHCGCSLKEEKTNENAFKIAQIIGATMVIISIIVFIVGVINCSSMSEYEYEYFGGREEVTKYVLGCIIPLVLGIGINIASKILKKK